MASFRSSNRSVDEAGASSVEYGLIAVAVAALIAVIVFLLGNAVEGSFNDSCDRINQEVTSSDC